MDALSFKQFALSCQYLKESIDIPKFYEINQGGLHDETSDDIQVGSAFALPSPRLACEAVEPKSLSKLLATIAALSLQPSRIEPRNISQIHACIPRPGGRAFCTRLYVFIPKGETAECLRYEQETNSLHSLGTVSEPIENPQLLFAVDPGRISDGYGEFSLTVGLLEAGHAIAQIQLVLGMFETDHAITFNPDLASPEPDGAQVCVAQIELRDAALDDDIDALDRCDVNVRNPRAVGDVSANFPRLADAVSNLRSARDDAGDLHAISSGEIRQKLSMEEFLNWSKTRTSSIDGFGTVPTRISEAEFDRLLNNWHRMHSSLPISGDVAINLAICSAGTVAPQIASFDLLDGKITEGPASDIAAILKPNIGIGAGYNIEEYAFFGLLSSPLGLLIDHGGSSAYAEIMLEAGMIAQTLGLACASHNLFSRPLRAYREANLEQAFQLDGQLFYVVACGRARIANPALSMIK